MKDNPISHYSFFEIRIGNMKQHDIIQFNNDIL